MTDGHGEGDTERSNCPRCGGRLSESPAADASSECEFCGFYEFENAKVDLPPLWREEPQLAGRLGLSRLFSHFDGPGFIGVRGDTVELVRADLKAGEDADPEEYELPSRDERADKIEELAGKYNDEYCGKGRSEDTDIDQ